MPSFFGPSPTLRIAIERDTVYTHPTDLANPSDPDAPSDDPLLHGFIHLTLPTPKRMNQIKVKLEGVATYLNEKETTLSKELCIQLNDEVLPAGEHTYEFSFIIPNSQPEYLRSAFGRSYLFAMASARPSGTLKADIPSSFVTIYVVSNPIARGDVPQPFGATLTHYTEALGPLSIDISGPYLTVGSLALYEISLLSPPSGVVITGITGILVQNVEIHNPNSSKFIQPPPIRHDLFKVDRYTVTSTPSKTRAEKAYSSSQIALPCLNESSKIEPVSEGKKWKYRKLSRLPHDDHLRPTTMEHSRSRIRLSHTLGVEIRYKKDANPTEYRVQLMKNVQVSSCCTLKDTFQLPSYSKDPQQNSKPHQKCECICAWSFQELYEGEESAIFDTPNGCEDEVEFILPSEPQCKTPAVGGDREGYQSHDYGGRSEA